MYYDFLQSQFVSNIFYLAIAMSHHGYLQTIQNYNNLVEHIDDI
jgi:ubiquitin conjugation factor E4 B